MRLLKTGELLYLCFLIPKYEREVAGGKFSASPCVRKELTVAGPVDFYILLKILKHNCSLIPAFLYINDSLILTSSEHQCYIF